jgi:hypothetical protein
MPIELPPVRSGEDALAAADVIMDALKEGAISAREGVDLLRVVEGLTRLTGTIAFTKKVARREVARAAQTLGFEHFFPSPPAANDYARRVRQMNKPEARAADEAAEAEDAAWENRLRRDAPTTVAPVQPDDGLPDVPPRGDRLQIVADSDDGERRTQVG